MVVTGPRCRADVPLLDIGMLIAYADGVQRTFLPPGPLLHVSAWLYMWHSTWPLLSKWQANTDKKRRTSAVVSQSPAACMQMQRLT